MGGGQYFSNAGVFLVQTLFGLYILAVLLRFLFQVFRADFYNPLSQFIVKVTNPPLKPLRRIIPGVAGLDMAAIFLIVVLKFVEILLIVLIKGLPAGPAGLLVLTLSGLLALLLNVFTFAILIQVIISWVSPGMHNPVTSLLYSLTEPLLRPARRILPPIHGMDLSPLLALIVLQLMNFLLVDPLSDVGGRLLASLAGVPGLA